MLKIQTQSNKNGFNEWIIVRVRGLEFKVTAKAFMKSQVGVVFDAPREVEIIRESLLIKDAERVVNEKEK